MRIRFDSLKQLVKEAIGKAYDILGVSRNASPEDIKRSYKKMAISMHPDRNQGKDTTADMVKLNVAYGLLSDPVKRKMYDRVGDKTLGDVPGYSSRPRSRPSPSPRPKPRPRPRPSHGQRTQDTGRRYYTYVDPVKRSRKFWWIEKVNADVMGRTKTVRVGWGRIGTSGTEKTHNFESSLKALKFILMKIGEKERKGYTRSPQPKSSNQPPPKSPKSKSPPKEKPSEKAQAGVASRQYKIYGKKKGSPAHTRYKGKVYVSPGDTKFRPGSKANIGLGTDGRLSVNDPNSGHTQSWNAESIEALADELLIEMILQV